MMRGKNTPRIVPDNEEDASESPIGLNWDNDDDPTVFGYKDNKDNSISPKDDDVAKVILKRIGPGNIFEKTALDGFYCLVVDSPLRVYSVDGQEVPPGDLRVDVKNPNGKLKEIVEKDVNVYIEAGGENGKEEAVLKWEFKDRQSKVIIARDKWYINVVKAEINDILRSADAATWATAGIPAVIPVKWWAKYEPKLESNVENPLRFKWYYKWYQSMGEHDQSGRPAPPPKGAIENKEETLGDWEVWFSALINGVEIESPSKRVKVVAVTISQDNDLWWFNGESPANYHTKVTLKSEPLIQGTYRWEVITGQSKVDFENNADVFSTVNDNDVSLISTASSSAANDVKKDVRIRLSLDGGQLSQLDTVVFAPYFLGHLRNEDANIRDIPGYEMYVGYICKIHYEIRDQFGRILPHDVPWNEDFNDDGKIPVSGISDYDRENWPWGDEAGWLVSPQDSIDNIVRAQLPVSPLTPPVLNYGLIGPKIDHVEGGWYIGSMSIGKGIKILGVRWQIYQDHGRHE